MRRKLGSGLRDLDTDANEGSLKISVRNVKKIFPERIAIKYCK